MDKEELRKVVKNLNEAIEEEQISRKNANMVLIEIFFTSICSGIICYGMLGIVWLAIVMFFVIEIGLTILVHVKRAAIIFCILFSLFWGSFGYAIGMTFKSVGLAIILSFICFIISYKKHSDGIRSIL